MPQTWETWALVLAGAGAAGLVQGMTGFAFSIVALSFWAWALAPELAAPIAVMGALTGQLTSLFSVRRGFEVSRIAPFIAGGVVGVPVGVFILHNIDPVRFRFALGVLFALYGAFGLLRTNAEKIAFGGWGLDAFVGAIGGVLGGLGGLSGSVPAIWTELRGWKRDVRRAIMQVYNIAMHSLTLAVYWRSGALNPTTGKLFALTLPLTLIASVYGARVYKRFSERGFARLVLALIFFSGLALAYGAARALWRF